MLRWLDDNISHGQIGQEDMQLYLLDVIERLRDERRFTLDQLTAERHRLRDAIIKRIGDCKRQAKAVGYQLALFSDAAANHFHFRLGSLYHTDPSRSHHNKKAGSPP